MSAEQVPFKLPDWLLPEKLAAVIQPILDDLAKQLAEERIAQSEKNLLDKAYWSQGHAVRLRDDKRFYQTPWGNWLLTNEDHFLVNDWLYEHFLNGTYLQVPIQECLDDAAAVLSKSICFCPADARFLYVDEYLSLNTVALSRVPFFTDEPGDGCFITHLPYYALKAAAASHPAGEWGESADAHVVNEGSMPVSDMEPEVWMRVNMPGTRLNNNMFVSRIHGHSMDDGRRGLTDDSFVVFEYWPKGSRQNKLVLVRGSFYDPETGSYALKQYHADTRNEQGEHQEITLRSLNPDKTRYPDIILKPDVDDDLVVVAEYCHVLCENEYTREPKPVVPEGLRDIHDGDTKKQRSKGLGEIHHRIFTKEFSKSGAVNDNDLPGLSWVCLAGVEGGPVLEISPLTFLPKFIKKLELQYADQIDTLLASNYRHHSRFKVVLPDAENYRIQPLSEFDEDFDDEFSSWNIVGLNKDSIHWFRVDASGVGRPVAGTSWSEGSAYRALATTEMFADVPEENITLLKNGWSLTEFELESERPEWLLSLMGSYTEAQKTLRLAWVNNSPVAWKTTGKDQELAVFNRETSPNLSVLLPAGATEAFKSGVLVLLHNGQDVESITLSDGDEWLLQLADLQSGEYVVQVIPADKLLAPVYMPFVIDDAATLMPTVADFDLQALTDTGETIDKNKILARQNWSQFENSQTLYDELVVRLPPHWPLKINLLSNVYIAGHFCRADDEGALDLFGEMAALLPYLKKMAAASIILDAGELGRMSLSHYRELKDENVQTRMATRWSEFIERKDKLLADAELLTQYWLSPLFDEWGGELRLMPDEDLLAVSGARRLFQWVRCEWEEDTVSNQSTPVLLVVIESDKALADDGELRVACNKFLKNSAKRRMFVTDGLRIAELRRGSHRNLLWFDIEAMKSDSQQVETWLGELEGGS